MEAEEEGGFKGGREKGKSELTVFARSLDLCKIRSLRVSEERQSEVESTYSCPFSHQTLEFLEQSMLV